MDIFIYTGFVFLEINIKGVACGVQLKHLKFTRSRLMFNSSNFHLCGFELINLTPKMYCGL